MIYDVPKCAVGEYGFPPSALENHSGLAFQRFRQVTEDNIRLDNDSNGHQ